MPSNILDLFAIESALRAVQKNFACINTQLAVSRDAMEDAVVERMMAGYVLVDQLLDQGVDPLMMGQHRSLMELNSRVLCGTDVQVRRQSADLIANTEKRFYEQDGGGIRDIVNWYSLHGGDTVWERAAGVYIRVLSEPQLFIEGNHRTGALIMSFLLAREGEPPFVLTVDNATAYFDPSTMIKQTRKRSFAMLVHIPHIKKKFAQLLRAQANPAFLLSHGRGDAPTEAANGPTGKARTKHNRR